MKTADWIAVLILATAIFCLAMLILSAPEPEYGLPLDARKEARNGS